MVVKKDRWWGGERGWSVWVIATDRGLERLRDARGINCKPLLRGESGDPLCLLPQDCFPQTQGYRTSKVEDEAARWKNSLWWRCEVHLLNTVCSMCSETGRSTQDCQDLVKLWLLLTSESCDEQNNVAHTGCSLAIPPATVGSHLWRLPLEKSQSIWWPMMVQTPSGYMHFFTIHITDFRSAVTVHGAFLHNQVFTVNV